jgi:hypothetical protein
MRTLRESYPETFNFDEFNSIRSYSKKLKYANERLRKICSGSARVVYQIDAEKVIKIAKNKKGLAQNNIESDYSLQRSSSIVARIFDVADGYTEDIGPFWLEMELAKKLTPNRFKQLTGFTHTDVQNYLGYFKSIMQPSNRRTSFGSNIPDELKNRAENSEFIQELTEMIVNYDMEYPGDFGRVNSYGEVLRDGTPTIVLIDFGLTSTVWNDFYKVNLR